MRRYNIWRPIMLIAVALLTRSLVTNLCLLLGVDQETAESLGMIGMIIAALIMYTRMMKRNRK